MQVHTPRIDRYAVIRELTAMRSYLKCPRNSCSSGTGEPARGAIFRIVSGLSGRAESIMDFLASRRWAKSFTFWPSRRSPAHCLPSDSSPTLPATDQFPTSRQARFSERRLAQLLVRVGCAQNLIAGEIPPPNRRLF